MKVRYQTIPIQALSLHTVTTRVRLMKAMDTFCAKTLQVFLMKSAFF